MSISVLIMAAGRGMRMRPLTNVIPKPMAPYLNTTLIGHGINMILNQIPNANIMVTVGHLGDLLAKHAIEQGASVIINTAGKGNAWWLSHTLIKNLDEPVIVLTADNICKIDLRCFFDEFVALPLQTCMIVPVRPVEGIAGDFITLKDNSVVASLSREEPADMYASGIQVVNPSRLRSFIQAGYCGTDYSFNDLWNVLIGEEALFCSSNMPSTWLSIDTLEALVGINSTHLIQ